MKIFRLGKIIAFDTEQHIQLLSQEHVSSSKTCFLFRKCIFSKKILWFRKATKVEFLPLKHSIRPHEVFWYDSKEYTKLKLLI